MNTFAPKAFEPGNKRKRSYFWTIPTAIALFVVGAQWLGLSSMQKSDAVYHAQKETALVETGHGQGSGVFFKRGNHVFLWTANHVVENEASIKIRRILRYQNKKAGEMVFPAHLILNYPAADAAVLLVDAPPSLVEGSVWASGVEVPGAPVFTVGNLYGSSFDGSVSTGVIAQLGVDDEDKPSGWPWKLADQTTVVIAPGSSGGPVFNQLGEVLGLIVGGPTKGLDSVAIFTPRRVIEAAANKEPWLFSDGIPSEAHLQSLMDSETAALLKSLRDQKLEIILQGIEGMPAPKKPSKKK